MGVSPRLVRCPDKLIRSVRANRSSTVNIMSPFSTRIEPGLLFVDERPLVNAVGFQRPIRVVLSEYAEVSAESVFRSWEHRLASLPTG
jgi:hypothetical protein